MLRCLSALAYDKGKSAIQKIRDFIDATIISPNTITSETIELQKAINLEQNRYMMDRFSHKFAGRATKYFTYVIEQGISEGVFHVTHPLETASFLMTGYVFVSNDVKALHDDELKQYIAAYKELLEHALGAEVSIFIK